MTADRIFAEHFRSYVDAGFEPRPVKPGDKACKEKGWNQPDAQLPAGIYDRWTTQRPIHGIGLRLGTGLPDGTTLAALDIDDDRYVRVSRYLLGGPPCGRVGRKGIAWFVRIRGNRTASRTSFDVATAAGAKVHVGELLGLGGFIVIPPTIHPGTGAPYRWVGKPLLEVDVSELPIIEV